MHSVSPKRHLVQKKNEIKKYSSHLTEQTGGLCKSGQWITECKNKLLSGRVTLPLGLEKQMPRKVSLQPSGRFPTALVRGGSQIYICTITSCTNTWFKMHNKVWGWGIKAGLAHRAQPSLAWESWKKNNEIIKSCCAWNHLWTLWESKRFVTRKRFDRSESEPGWQAHKNMSNQVTVKIVFNKVKCTSEMRSLKNPG